MRIEYGPKEDIASIDFVDEIGDREIVADIEVPGTGGCVYLGMSAEGKILQMEVLRAAEFLTAQTLSAAYPMDETIVFRSTHR